MQLPYNMIPVKRWYAFKAQLPPRSDKKHHIIIIYKDQTIIKYFYVTSQVEKAKKYARNDIGSIVELNKSNWDVLDKDSCIQCNVKHLHDISESEFKQLYESHEMEYFGEIPKNVKKLLISAICASESFTDSEKATYTVTDFE
ncbi:hypothetical protein R80B4_01902 [Fibrobacteres bacterium R8-0-B4]